MKKKSDSIEGSYMNLMEKNIRGLKAPVFGLTYPRVQTRRLKLPHAHGGEDPFMYLIEYSYNEKSNTVLLFIHKSVKDNSFKQTYSGTKKLLLNTVKNGAIISLNRYLGMKIIIDKEKDQCRIEWVVQKFDPVLF